MDWCFTQNRIRYMLLDSHHYDQVYIQNICQACEDRIYFKGMVKFQDRKIKQGNCCQTM